MELLHKLNQEGTTIIMVTHDPDQAREVSRNIQIIDGQISDFRIYAPLQSLDTDKVLSQTNETTEESNTEQEIVDV